MPSVEWALEATKGDVEAAARLVAQGPLIDAMHEGAPMDDIRKLIDKHDLDMVDTDYHMTPRHYARMTLREADTETRERWDTPMSPMERQALLMDQRRKMEILEAMEQRR